MLTKNLLKTKKSSFIWYDLTALTSAEEEILISQHHFSSKILAYAQDQHEHPRYDLQADSTMLVYLAVIQKQQQYLTSPLTFIIKDQTCYTFYQPEAQGLIDDLKQVLHTKTLNDLPEFLLLALYQMTLTFTSNLLKLNEIRSALDEQLHQNITNEKLQKLAELEKSLIYLNSGAQTNLLMLETLKHLAVGQDLTKNKNDQILLKDVLFEARQAQRMAQIASDVTAKISNTSNNILNNNLNNTMKFLTVWSLVLTIPTIITGFFGMNVFLPTSKTNSDWILIILLNLGLIIILIWYFKKKKLL